MPFRWDAKEHVAQFRYVLKWTAIVTPVAASIGAACALFLWSLDRVTQMRLNQPDLLFLLPLAGVAVAGLYHRFGQSAEGGNNLIIEQIHRPGGGVPSRMAPLILVGTVITHLFGGSSGREGTAVQMGGSIAGTFARLFRLADRDIRILLMAGIAGGFGAVFGTPLAGAVFAMEVLVVGRMSYEALIPCLIAGLVADQTCAAFGIRHASYHIISILHQGAGATGSAPGIDPAILAKVAVASIAFGLASLMFAELQHGMQHIFRAVVRRPLLRAFVGGCVIIVLTYLVGTRDYLGLGVHADDPGAVTIQSCFKAGGATDWSWWWKSLFTAVTLGSGFKGGEVTPLFYVGASLGNVAARVLDAVAYTDLFAGLGFVAIFAGASNTPLACTIMGIELFGADGVAYIAVACYLSYLFSGHTGIYLSQRVAVPKTAAPYDGASMGKTRNLSPSLVHRIAAVLRTPAARFEDVSETCTVRTDESDRRRNAPDEVATLRVSVENGGKAGDAGAGQDASGDGRCRQIIKAAVEAGISDVMTCNRTCDGNGRDPLGRHVALTAPRDVLERFVGQHAHMLEDRVMRYDGAAVARPGGTDGI